MQLTPFIGSLVTSSAPAVFHISWHRHISHSAASKWRAKRGASNSGEAITCCRNVDRTAARRSRAAAWVKQINKMFP